MLLLCLVTFGIAKVGAIEWLKIGYLAGDTITVNNLRFAKVDFYDGVYVSKHYAWLVDIIGEDEIVAVPDTITCESTKYCVQGVGCPITNNSVKTLFFKGRVYFYFETELWYNSLYDDKSVPKFFSGRILSTSLQSIVFEKDFYFYTSSIYLYCDNLTDLYIKGTVPNLYYNNWGFSTAPASNITLHVYDKTPNELNELRTKRVYRDFKEIVNHTTTRSYTLVSDGNATVSLLQLKDNADYSLAYDYTRQAQIKSGSKYGSVKVGENYAVEIKGVTPAIQTVQLKRNGSVVELSQMTKFGETVYYYNEPVLQDDVIYEVCVTDKICSLTFMQTGYRGNITYTKTVNRMASSGVIYSDNTNITCYQGSTIELSIPYNQYTPQSLTLNGTTIPLTLANGRATATITVPAAETAAATLTWQEPQTTYPHLQPQIMVLRAGEGDVIFKGLRYSSDTDMIEHNENAIEEGNTNGAWLNLKGDVNCSEAVTTITVPDVDDSGHWLSEGCWGFRAVIKPVKGQVLKTLLMGHITEEEGGRQVISWEDMLHGSYSTNELYFKHDTETNTYTLTNPGDYQNFDSGDYILNISMGPDETTIETGKTISFVRKGGRGRSDICWYDGEKSYYFGEGSSSVVVPNNELENDDLMLEIVAEEGETFHVYKNGADITSQFQKEGANYYNAALESESATYTLHIDEAPDANPVWKVLQHEGIEGTQILVSRTGGDDEALVCNNATDELTIDDSNVTKVTLNVPVSTEDRGTPLLVLKNGADVSYQFKEYADGMLTYEVPTATLYNTTWDISYDLSHQQTFVVNGGTKEKVLEIEYEYMDSRDTINVTPNGLASFYLAPFDNTYNGCFYLTIYVNEGETLTVLRNGLEVTDKFDEITEAGGNKYFELDADNAGFNGREAATWQIIITGAEDEDDEITWTAVATGDMAEGMESMEFYLDVLNNEATVINLNLPSGTNYKTSTISYDELDEGVNFSDLEFDQVRAFVTCKPGYIVSSITFNGVEYQLTPVSGSSNQYRFDVDVDDEEFNSFITSGTWMVEFKKETITWNLKAVGEIPQGAKADLSVDGGGLQVVVEPGKTSDTGNYEFAEGGYPMDLIVYVPAGYTFTLLRNGEDKTESLNYQSTNSQGISTWSASWDDDEDMRLYSVDTDWAIVFTKINKFDVNEDGNVNISDVTKLVNKIIGK